MNTKIIYALFLLLGLSVFVLAENITDNETGNATPDLPLASTILNLLLSDYSFNSGEIIEIKTQLTTEDNTPLPNEDIYFYLDENQIGDSPTNIDGIATAYFDTSTTNPGSHIISAEYYGSEQYMVSVDYDQIDITGEIIPTVESPIDIQNTAENDTRPIQECIQETWIEQMPIFDNCTQTYERAACFDEPINETCGTENVTYSYECVVSYQNTEKIAEKCKTKSYIIKNKYQLNVDDYVCSSSKNAGTVTMMCDSIYDGNGDGICTSGESCLKYEFNNNEYIKYEKNSKDDFMQSDESYFLNKATIEEVGQ